VAAVGLVRPSHRMTAGAARRPARGGQRSQSTPGGRGAARRTARGDRGHRIHGGCTWLVRPSHRMAAGVAGEGRPEVTEYTRGRGRWDRGHRVHRRSAGLRDWSSDGGSEALTKIQPPQSEK
jgi:hypothetical protein